MNTARSIPIAEIGDGGAQMRVEMKPDVVRDYADDMARNGVASGTAGMPGLGECEVIAFPYWRAGMAVNVKYRALSEKAFKQIEGGELRFWNLDEVLKAKSERVFIVEGEVDGLALLEAGVAAGEVMSVGTKGQALEGGHRVGASIRWPGVIEKGSLAGDMVFVSDLYTTFARIAGNTEGIPRDRIVDGIDQTALFLKGNTHGRRDYVHLYEVDQLRATVKQNMKIHSIHLSLLTVVAGATL